MKLLAQLKDRKDLVAAAKQVSGKTVEQAREIVAGKASSAKAKKKADRIKRLKKLVTSHDPGEIPDAKYNVVYADPPWQLTLGNDEPVVTSSTAYNTMSLDEIKQFGAEQVLPTLADDCHLYLWATNHTLPHVFDVVKAWGFEYRTTVTWAKRRPGTGQGFRGSTEHLIVARRGNAPFTGTAMGTWFESECKRLPEGAIIDDKPAVPIHSAKPEIVYDIIEKASPAGMWIELFARRQRDGWLAWGDQIHNDIVEQDGNEHLDGDDDLTKGA